MCLSKASSTHTLDGHLRVETHEHPRVFGVMETSVGHLPFNPGPVYSEMFTVDCISNYFSGVFVGILF